MSKIQSTSFKSVGEFLDVLSEEELTIVQELRSIIFDVLPECTEKLAYNVPFYYMHSRICFVWPASIRWGGVDSGVALGFCRGHLISDKIKYLEKGNRKNVFTKIFTSENQIDPEILKSYLFEAKEIDERLNRSKTKK